MNRKLLKQKDESRKMSTLLYIRTTAVNAIGAEAQQEALAAYAARQGLTDLKTLEFPGLSEDTAIHMLLTYVNRGDKVLVYGLDRLTRSETKRAALLEALLNRGVQLLCIKDEANSQLTSKAEAPNPQSPR